MSKAYDVSLQYDVMGNNYLQAQQTVVNPSSRWGRAKVSEFVGSLSGKVVVDAGCGGGHDSIEFTRQGATSVFAFDPSEVMLDDARALVAKSGIDSITIARGTYEAIPFESNSVDVLIGIFSLHYVANLDAAFKEISRVVKPGGTIAFVSNHPEDVNYLKTSPYKGQEVVAVKIYGGNVTIHQPSHVLSEYFSPLFLKNFSLDNFDEHFITDVNGNTLKRPMLFSFSATKRL